MKRMFGSGWLRAFVIWTALIVVLTVPFWSAATTPSRPCAYPGAVNQDATLPPCPPDDANYEAIGIGLLVLLWFGGTAVLLVAFGLSRVRRWLGARRRISSG
jgi:hypothetical protein